MAIFFALLTLIGWASGDIFVTLSSRKLGNINAFFWWLVFSFLLSSAYIPFAPKITDLWMFLFALILGVLYALADLSYFKALESKAAIGGAIAGSFPIITVILSIILFRERVTFYQIIGIVLTLIGIILTSVNFKKLLSLEKKELLSDRAVRFALFTFFIWGIYFALVRIPIEHIGWFWPKYLMNLFFIVLLFSGKINDRALHLFKSGEVLGIVAMNVLLIGVADFSYNLGISYGYTTVVAPIAGSYPVLFVVFARLIFREPLNRKQKIGIVFSLLGIILISFFQT